MFSDEDDAKLQEELAEGYLRFLQAKDENQRMEGTRLAKRTKKAKVRQQKIYFVFFVVWWRLSLGEVAQVASPSAPNLPPPVES